MNTTLPSVAELQARLQTLNTAELERLAQSSTVPFGTLLKIRRGETANPGIETVRKFIGLLPMEGAPAGQQMAG